MNRFDLHVDEVTGAEIRASVSGKYLEYDEHERIVAELTRRIADLEFRLAQEESSSRVEVDRLTDKIQEHKGMLLDLVRHLEE